MRTLFSRSRVDFAVFKVYQPPSPPQGEENQTLFPRAVARVAIFKVKDYLSEYLLSLLHVFNVVEGGVDTSSASTSKAPSGPGRNICCGGILDRVTPRVHTPNNRS